MHSHSCSIFALLNLCMGNPSVTGGFPLTKASDAELWCFLCAPDQTIEQTLEAPVIWSAMMSMWRHRNAKPCTHHHVHGIDKIMHQLLWMSPRLLALIIHIDGSLMCHDTEHFRRAPVYCRMCVESAFTVGVVVHHRMICYIYIHTSVKPLRLGRNRELRSKPPFFRWQLAVGILRCPTSCGPFY